MGKWSKCGPGLNPVWVEEECIERRTRDHLAELEAEQQIKNDYEMQLLEEKLEFLKAHKKDLKELNKDHDLIKSILWRN